MAVVRGKDLAVIVDSSGTDVAVGASIDCTFTTTANLLDITSKDSTNAKEFAADMYEWTVTANNFYDPAKTLNAEETLAYLKAGTKVLLNFGVLGTSYPVAGQFLEGYAYVRSCTLSGAVGDSAKFNVEFQGTGDWTLKNYSPAGSMS